MPDNTALHQILYDQTAITTYNNFIPDLFVSHEQNENFSIECGEGDKHKEQATLCESSLGPLNLYKLFYQYKCCSDLKDENHCRNEGKEITQRLINKFTLKGLAEA